MVLLDNLLKKNQCIGFIFYTHVYNNKIWVKFDFGYNQPIWEGGEPFFNFMFA